MSRRAKAASGNKREAARLLIPLINSVNVPFLYEPSHEPWALEVHSARLPVLWPLSRIVRNLPDWDNDRWRRKQRGPEGS